MPHLPLRAAALAVVLTLPAAPVLAQGHAPSTGLSAAAVSLGYTAAPATLNVSLPELSVRADAADPSTTGSVRSHPGSGQTKH